MIFQAALSHRALRGVISVLVLLAGVASGTCIENGDRPQEVQSPFSRNRSDVLTVDVPLVELPFNFQSGYYAPSMAQSIGLTKSFHEAGFHGIDWLADRLAGTGHRGASIAVWGTTAAAFMIYSSYAPPGVTWAHEEFHRAVLWNRGVSSRNSVYSFPFFSDLASVDHVSDSDLVRLKRDFPHDMVRAGEAGYEGQQQLVAAFHEDDFYRGRPQAENLSTLLSWYSDLSNILYVGLCNTSIVDTLTAQTNRADGTNVARRDFIGFDFTAWVYDLFRPDEPYAQRGIHPSGVGIDRYIRRSELTPAERSFLAREFYLSLTSLADPLLVGFPGIAIGGDSANAYVQHYLTSFGHSINVTLMLKRGESGLAIALLNQQNRVAHFPGLDMRIVNWPVCLGRVRLGLGPRLSLWTQPSGQGFETSRPAPGGLASLRVDWPATRGLHAFAEIEAKTSGWVAGNASLDPNVSARLGIGYLLR
ncbi:MAG TPA: hypothetical protein VMH22_10485 [bacterium]|nr:hypothetical protein [bacterium]